MPRPRATLRPAVLVMMIGSASMAQEAMSYTLKLAGGPTFGGLLSPLGRAGYAYGFDFELGYRLAPRTQIVAGLGWRAFPGDFVNVSFIPFTYAATNVNPTIYETRVRKPEGQGFQLTGLYRSHLPSWEGAYWQGGLRLGSNKVTETDTGTQLVTDGRSSSTSGNVLAVNTIAQVREKTTVSIGPMAGFGYEFREFTFEVNVWMASIESAAVGKKSGMVSELAFGFRF